MQIPNVYVKSRLFFASRQFANAKYLFAVSSADLIERFAIIPYSSEWSTFHYNEDTCNEDAGTLSTSETQTQLLNQSYTFIHSFDVICRLHKKEDDIYFLHKQFIRRLSRTSSILHSGNFLVHKKKLINAYAK
ncbi:hypothetical protein PUN28_008460 [Cardiocondyla obscurior]|uniref:Uncharacterized protein n=1 Tax=Cardiocondyla obscurior TaxID=286306 RepID=A0AAW2FXU6_9HYME